MRKKRAPVESPFGTVSEPEMDRWSPKKITEKAFYAHYMLSLALARARPYRRTELNRQSPSGRFRR
jgi:hypothetical protein